MYNYYNAFASAYTLSAPGRRATSARTVASSRIRVEASKDPLVRTARLITAAAEPARTSRR